MGNSCRFGDCLGRVVSLGKQIIFLTDTSCFKLRIIYHKLGACSPTIALHLQTIEISFPVEHGSFEGYSHWYQIPAEVPSPYGALLRHKGTLYHLLCFLLLSKGVGKMGTKY